MAILGLIAFAIMWVGILIGAIYFCFIDDFRIGWFIFALFVEYIFARVIYALFLSIFT